MGAVHIKVNAGFMTLKDSQERKGPKEFPFGGLRN